MGSIQHISALRLVALPAIGHWYRRPHGQLFEVVAIDEDADTVELQFFDGTIDEFELDVWTRLSIVPVAAPEDWSGSVDMDSDDYTGNEGGDYLDGYPDGYHDPLGFMTPPD